jgi:hypothetical protein
MFFARDTTIEHGEHLSRVSHSWEVFEIGVLLLSHSTTNLVVFPKRHLGFVLETAQLRTSEILKAYREASHASQGLKVCASA